MQLLHSAWMSLDAYKLDVIVQINHPFYFMSDGVHDIIYKCMYIRSVRVLVQLCVLVIHCMQ